MRADTKTAAIKRLARIEGQVRGVAKMVDGDRYCIDVVRQVQAIKAALTSLEKVVLSCRRRTFSKTRVFCFGDESSAVNKYKQ